MAEEWPKIMKTNFTIKHPKKKIRTASKTTAAYWSQKIRLERKPGWESSHYFVRIQAHGSRRKLKLSSTIREEAAREAAALYLSILSEGWPLDEVDRNAAPILSGLPPDPSIEAWFKFAQTKSMVADATLEAYWGALQTIVGEILGIPKARKPESRTKIKEFPISELTKDSLRAWLDRRIEAARKLDGIKSKRAINTARSLVVNARSLFSAAILEAVEINPDTIPYIPFKNLKLPPKYLPRYTSRFDPRLLLKVAAADLADPSADDEFATFRYEQWKILYLALVAGLRYKEIDRLRVQEIMINSARISIRSHEDFNPKTRGSTGEVLVGEAALKVLVGMLEKTSGSWFIADAPPKKTSKYRAWDSHDAVIKWLRNYEERGIRPLKDVKKPLHELRKEAGTLVNHDHGLVATQHFLRHQSITTTASTYVETRGIVTTGLG